MPQTNINIRIDEDLKRDFDSLCSDIGMNMTTAFCIFAKTAVREQCIPFELKTGAPNAETIKALENVLRKQNLSKGFTSVKDLMEDLYADN
ncbi:MAG: type II toxin-antitoxin system RelB/DinJ family antitoxin [Bacillota bacterium]